MNIYWLNENKFLVIKKITLVEYTELSHGGSILTIFFDNNYCINEEYEDKDSGRKVFNQLRLAILELGGDE